MHYSVIQHLPDGHRLFTKSGHNPDAPLIADNSGYDPAHTDDGELWLDYQRPLLIEQEEGHTYCSIPILTAEGKQWKTPTDPATILQLASDYRWDVRVVVRQSEGVGGIPTKIYAVTA